jgi:hypothetical protein
VPAAPDAGPGRDDDGEEPPDGSDDDRDRPDQGPDDSAPGAAPSPTTSAAPPPAPPPAPPSPATPADADDCKRGGWQHLVDDAGRPFANQGECVSYASRL